MTDVHNIEDAVVLFGEHEVHVPHYEVEARLGDDRKEEG